MDPRFLVGVAASGIVLGLLTTFLALSPGVETGLWLVVGAAWLLLALRRPMQRRFSHLAMGGMAAGFLAADVNALWWDTYLANHPGLVQQAAERELTLTATGNIMNGLLLGVALGAVLGGIATAVVRIRDGAADLMAGQTTGDEEE